jgi:hypothetical protein
MVFGSQSLKRNLLLNTDSQGMEVEMQNSCVQNKPKRNRSRSKRRAIFCPIHECHIDSVSQKYSLYADQVDQLQQRGMSKRNATMALFDRTTVSLTGEWIESFWCDRCQKTEWYHVKRSMPEGAKTCQYTVLPVAHEVWQHATGVVDVNGNPSVSAFTRRQSRTMQNSSIKDFKFMFS